MPRKPGQVNPVDLPDLPDLPSLDSAPPSPPPAGAVEAAAKPSFGEPEDRQFAPSQPPLDLDDEFSPEQLAGVSAEELDAMEEAAGEKPFRIQPAASVVPAVETDEVSALAGYGPTPENIVAAVPYALRVFRRRRELTAALDNVQSEQKLASELVDEALQELGAALHARRHQAGLSPLQQLFEAVTDAEKTIDDQADVRMKERETAEKEIEKLQQDLAAAEREAEPLQEREKQIKQRLGEAEKQLERARAMLQRVLIEMRALQGATEPPGQDRIDSLKAAQQARQSEVEVARTRVAEISKEMGQASLELAEKMKAVSAALTARQNAADALEHRERAHEQRTREAEVQRGAAFIALAAAALQKRLLPDPETKAVGDARQHLAQVEHRLQVHQDALQCYDRDGYRQGVFTAAALVGLVFILIILLIVL